MDIRIVQGDITKLKVNAVVNAANNTLLGGGGVDGAIHHAAGPELLRHCCTLNGCDTGNAVITPGFNLPAQYIIHTVGPVWKGGTSNEAALLAQCYRSCLKIAAHHGIASVAFPAISCGIYGYPIHKAADIALSTLYEEGQHYTLPDTLYIVCYNAEIARAYGGAMSAFAA